MLTIVSCSAEETLALGKRLGALLRPGDFIALTGDLGCGKTVFARGVAAGIGVDPAIRITSPTYTLMNMYDGKFPLYHFDLYRLGGDQDVAELGFEEYFYGTGACIVEWAERLRELLPQERLTLFFNYRDDDSRSIAFQPCGSRYDEILNDFTNQEKAGIVEI